MRWANKDLCRKKNVELAKQFLSGVLTITQTLPQNLYFFPNGNVLLTRRTAYTHNIFAVFFLFTRHLGTGPNHVVNSYTEHYSLFPLPYLQLFCFGRNYSGTQSQHSSDKTQVELEDTFATKTPPTACHFCLEAAVTMEKSAPLCTPGARARRAVCTERPAASDRWGISCHCPGITCRQFRTYCVMLP